MSEDEPAGREVPVVWVDNTDGKAEYVNQFSSIFQPDEFTIQLGQLIPPAISGNDPDERRKQVESLQFVPINLVSRVILSRTKLVELIEVLQKNLEAHDTAMETRKPS